MSEPTTAAGRKMLGVLDSLMAVLHGIATADLPENIAAHAKTTDQVKEELAALVLAIEAEAAAPAPLDVRMGAALLDWYDTTHGNEFGHDHHCPAPWNDNPHARPIFDGCTCGWSDVQRADALRVAIEEADRG